MKDTRFHIIAIDKTQRAFKAVTAGLSNVISSVTKATAAFAAFAAAGVTFLAARSLSAVDEIGKLSKSLGISTENLATFQYMAALGGATLDQFVDSAKDVSKNVFEFVSKGTGEATDAFLALGITVEDLRPIMNDQVAIMGLITDELNRIPDGATKTALAYKLLGGSAVSLLPAIKGGTAAFEEARLEADRLGLVMSGKAVAGVEAANDSITKLGLLFKGISDQLTAAVAPGIEYLADLLRNNLLDAFEANGGGVRDWAVSVIVSIVRVVQKATNAVFDFIQYSIRVYNGYANLFGGTPIRDGVSADVEGARISFMINTDAMIAAVQNFDRSMEHGFDGFSGSLDEVGDVVNNVSDRLAQYAEASKDTFKQLQTAGISTVTNLENKLLDFVRTGKFSFNDMVNSMIADLARLAIQQNITGPLAAGLSSFFGGFRATGGPVSAGMSYVVGENGPELFVANQSGSIISNDNAFSAPRAAANNGGTNITNIFHIDATSSTDPEQVRMQVEKGIIEAMPTLKATTRHDVFHTARRVKIA